MNKPAINDPRWIKGVLISQYDKDVEIRIRNDAKASSQRIGFFFDRLDAESIPSLNVKDGNNFWQVVKFRTNNGQFAIGWCRSDAGLFVADEIAEPEPTPDPVPDNTEVSVLTPMLESLLKVTEPDDVADKLTANALYLDTWLNSTGEHDNTVDAILGLAGVFRKAYELQNTPSAQVVIDIKDGQWSQPLLFGSQLRQVVRGIKSRLQSLELTGLNISLTGSQIIVETDNIEAGIYYTALDNMTPEQIIEFVASYFEDM